MRAALALLGLAGVLSLTACGNSLSLGASVAKAAVKTTAMGSEHVVITGHVTANGDAVQMSGSGDFQSSPALGQASFTLSGGPANGTMDEVISGDELYVKSALFSSMLPAGKQWVKVDLAQAGKHAGLDLSQFAQASPADTLAALEKAGSVKKIGTDTIDGTPTTHYQATVDVSKSAKLAKEMGDVPVDVWIDGNGLLRRLSEDVSAGTVGSSFTMNFSNYGEQVAVQVPSAAETVDMTKLGG